VQRGDHGRSGREAPGRRFAGRTIRRKPLLVQKANQRQKDHKKNACGRNKIMASKKLKKLYGYLFFLSLLEQGAGAFRAVQTVVAACQGSVVSAGYTPLRQSRRVDSIILHCERLSIFFLLPQIVAAIRVVTGAHPCPAALLPYRRARGSARIADSGRLSGARCRTPGPAPRCFLCF